MAFKIDRNLPDPIYQQIRDWIRQQITSGNWPEHYRLKTEIDLVEELGVNRGTLRKAIAELIAEGMLVTIHGRGTFVSARTLEQPLAEDLVTFSEDLIKKGIPFETSVLQKGEVFPTARVASLLAVSTQTKLFFLNRVRKVRQEPLAHIQNYVLHERIPQILQVDFSRQRLFETLEKQFGISLSWGRRTFQAQLADSETALVLDIPPGSPVMYIEQVTYLQDGTPVELSDIWLRGDRFRLSAFVKRGDVQSTAATNTQEYIELA